MSEQQANIDQENVDRILAAAEGASLDDIINVLRKRCIVDAKPYCHESFTTASTDDVAAVLKSLHHPDWDFGFALDLAMSLLLNSFSTAWRTMTTATEQERRDLGDLVAGAGHKHVCITGARLLAEDCLRAIYESLTDVFGVPGCDKWTSDPSRPPLLEELVKQESSGTIN